MAKYLGLNCLLPWRQRKTSKEDSFLDVIFSLSAASAYVNQKNRWHGHWSRKRDYLYLMLEMVWLSENFWEVYLTENDLSGELLFTFQDLAELLDLIPSVNKRGQVWKVKVKWKRRLRASHHEPNDEASRDLVYLYLLLAAMFVGCCKYPMILLPFAVGVSLFKILKWKC